MVNFFGKDELSRSDFVNVLEEFGVSDFDSGQNDFRVSDYVNRGESDFYGGIDNFDFKKDIFFNDFD